MRRAPIAAMTLVSLAACGVTHQVAWQITDVPAGTAVIHAEVREGSATGPIRAAYDLDLATTPPTAMATMPAMNVPNGTYFAYAEARDASCGVKATGSRLVTLPVSGTVVIPLATMGSGASACPAMCHGGHCGSATGMDGSVPDATGDMPGSDLGDGGGVDLAGMDLGDGGGVDLGGVDLGGTDLGTDAGCAVNGCPGGMTCQPDGTCVSSCPDATACMTGTETGVCHAGACCTGCWDGTTCQGGVAAYTCAAGGVMCAACGGVGGMDCSAESVCVPRVDHFALSPISTFLVTPIGRVYSAGDDSHHERGDRAPAGGANSFEETTGLPDGFGLLAGTTQFATCVITIDGQLYCWGTNSFGLLGTGGSMGTSTSTPARLGTSLWATIDGGSEHICAIRVDGALFCWGDDSNGALGLGGGTPGAVRLLPTQVGSSLWRNVSAGDVHTCAVRADRTLWCWGQNAHGQLGNGTTAAHTMPTQVGTDTNWRLVSAEGTHSCAVKHDGTLWCWGDSRFGQLGIGTPSGDVTSPMQVGVATDWSTVSAGQFHTCGLRGAAGDQVYCWGFNGTGAIGNGAPSGEEDLPVNIAAPSGTGWTSVTAGWQMTCGATTVQDYCWGDNTMGGRLGLGPSGTMGPVTTPTGVSF